VIPLLVVASIWYLLLTAVLSLAQHQLEKRYGRGHAPTATTKRTGSPA
jgi:polar amino acid transport system permease protein